MPATLAASVTGRSVRRVRSAALVPAMVFAFVAALQLELVFSKSINWDEFYHLSEIYQRLSGERVAWLQTPYTVLFAWVPSLPGSDIDHIQLIRLLILPFELAATGLIFLMARQLAGRDAALIAALAYVTGGYVFLHAFALRADMISAALLSAALWLALCRPMRPLELALTGLLLLLAFVATIKSVLWAPAFLGVSIYRLRSPAHRRLLVAAVGVALLAGVALLLAAPVLPSTGLLGMFGRVAELGNSSVARMFSGGLFPQGRYLLKQILIAPGLSILVVIAVALTARRETPRRALITGLLLPVLWVAIYRNSFPYFFAFILPPVAVGIAPAASWLLKRYPSALLLGFLALNAAAISWAENRDVLAVQRQAEAGIHAIFPEPVTYIDDVGFVSDFPRAHPRFASGWALANYRAAGEPVYTEAVAERAPPFLLRQGRALEAIDPAPDDENALLTEDARTLRDNYIPHWGSVFVAGKRIAPGQAATDVTLAIAGTYTLEGAALVVDGKTYRAGETVDLSRGLHHIGGGRDRAATLRWGDHLPRPSFPWPSGLIFTDY